MAGNLARGNDLKIGQGRGLRILTWFGVAFLLLPLVILVAYSFNDARTGTEWTGFTLKWYRDVAHDASLWAAVRNSLIIALISTLVSTILGTMGAFLLAKHRFRGKKLFQNLLYVPVIVPEIIFGISLLALFMLVRFPLGIFSVICAHITFIFPFVTMIIMARVINLPDSLGEASLDLGATRWQTFRKVILPNISPGVVSGALFGFTLSIDDFIVTFFTAGVGASTLPLKIYSLIKFGITPAINAISTLLILFTLLALYLSNRLQKSQRINRKIRLALAVVAGAVIMMLMATTFFSGSGQKLNLYNYSNYIDENLLKKFESETGINVTLDYFNDNEEMLSKLQMGVSGYDIIVSSGYMVETLKNKGLIAPIDKSAIPNCRYLTPGFGKMEYDTTGRYYVPYVYCFTGIVYNSDYVKEPVDSWAALWDPRYAGKISMVDDMKEAFAVACMLLGYDLNSADTVQLREARDLLMRQKPLLKKYESNSTELFLTNGDVWIAQGWTGQIARLVKSDPKFRMGQPKQGALFWSDNLCIPANAPNKANAEKFINFLLDPANSAQNMNAITYAMPNDSAVKLLDSEFRNNPIIFPDIKDLTRLKIYRDAGDFTRHIDKAWTELKVK
jgi:spermidine/putrescine transport system permease protein